MAGNTVEFILKARDEASKAIRRLAGEVGGLSTVTAKLAGTAGAVGLVAGAAVTAGAAVVAMGRHLANDVERLDRLASATGATIPQLQTLEMTFENAGIASEQAGKALTFLNRAIGRGDPLLKAMGITSRNAYEAMMQLSDVFARSDDTAKKAAISQKLLGKASAEVSGSMASLRTDTVATNEAMREAGALYGEGVTADAKKLDAQLDALNIRFRGVKTTLATEVAPAAITVIEQFVALWKVARALASFPPIRLVVDVAGSALDFRGTLENLREIRDHARVVAEYFKNGADSARDLQGALGLRGFAGFSGGAGAGSGGKGASGSWGPPATKDSLGKVKVGGKQIGTDEDGNPIYGDSAGGAKTSARAQRIAELMRIMQVGRRVALEFAAALDAIETSNKATDTAKKVLAAGGAGLSPEALGVAYATADRFGAAGPTLSPKTIKRPGHSPSGPVDATAYATAVKEVLDAAPKVSEAIIDMGMQWSDQIALITSSTGMLGAGLEGLWNGLQNGFAQVFQGLLSKTQTFRSAIRTIFTALVQEVLSILARIVAAKIFEFILNLILPGLGTGVSGVISATSKSMAPSPGRDLQSRSQITVNVNALDSRGVSEALASPRGELRAALEAAGLAGAY
jgi:hypothetical protein